MASIDQRTGAASEQLAEAIKVSRVYDYVIAITLLIVLTAAFHIHFELTAGDWDFWVDWKDQQWWVTLTPILLITFPAATQYILWTFFRLPIAATLCCVGLLIGEWISRVHGFHYWTNYPYSLVWPATMIPSAIALDTILMLTRNYLMTAIVGGTLFALLFFPGNWPMLAAYHLPVEHLGNLVSVADLIGYSFPRTATPEYIRIIERGTLRTFGGYSVPVSAFFSGFVCVFVYLMWWYLGMALSTTKFVPNALKKYMGL